MRVYLSWRNMLGGFKKQVYNLELFLKCRAREFSSFMILAGQFLLQFAITRTMIRVMLNHPAFINIIVVIQQKTKQWCRHSH